MAVSPELSVCIPTYNAAKYLPETIASVMRQGLSDFEIVIVDNASEDDTASLVQNLRNPHIRYFRNERNMGPHNSFARSIAEARGEFIKPLCADDVLLDGTLLRQIQLMRRHPDVVLVGCDSFITDEALKIDRIWSFYHGFCGPFRMKNACFSGVTNYIGGPSNYMFRHSAAHGVVGDTTYHAYADLKYALEILERGRYASINEPGILYRRHPNSDTFVGVSQDHHRFEPMRLVDEYDWWNPFNFLLAVRRGGPEWRRAVTRRWWRALLPHRILCGLLGGYDAVRLYLRFLRDSRRMGLPQQDPSGRTLPANWCDSSGDLTRA